MSNQEEPQQPQETKELPHDQREVADELLRNFLVTLTLAFAGVVILRIFPAFLKDLPERRWLEWLLVSLIGVCAYLIWNIAMWYHEPIAKFKEYRPWYRATAARGPILALVILLALTNITFQVELPAVQEQVAEEVSVEEPGPAGPENGAAEPGSAVPEAAQAPEDAQDEAAPAPTFDFGVNFGQAHEAVLLVAAFLLGFYSRLAQGVLQRIAGFIFGDIFKQTYSDEEAFEKRKREQKEEAEAKAAAKKAAEKDKSL